MSHSLLRKRPAGSLAEASLDIGRVLADRDGVTFRADGTCMYPTIRPGDVLSIQSRLAADVSVGDVVVCRRPAHLFCHRVVAKGLEEGRAFIVTRHDRTEEGGDGPTFDENLLGVVVDVRRKGISVPLRAAAHSRPLRFYFALRLTLIELRLRIILGRRILAAAVQTNAVYRRMMRTWLRLSRPDISYVVRLPMPALGDAVYRELAPEDFNVQRDWRGRPVGRWTLVMQLDGSPKPAAWLTLRREASGAWVVDESFVRARYRGAGLTTLLKEKAQSLLQKDRPVEGEGANLLWTAPAQLQ
ncbi:MAG: hypothetical protein EG826_09410 [Deltaproteobacteria bacterium]|nr:hypothetical protein [Deltaproteobacteria bacterium]